MKRPHENRSTRRLGAIIAAVMVACSSVSAAPVAPGEMTDTSVSIKGDVLGVTLLGRGAGRESFVIVARDDGLQAIDWGGGKSVVAGALPRADVRGMAWCVAGEDRKSGGEVFLLSDTGVVTAWDGQKVREVVKTGGTLLPDGVFHMRFASDFDGDGRVDFAIPRAEGFQLYFGTDAAPRLGPAVRHEIDVDVSLDSLTDRNPKLEQSVTIPAFSVADQNGDGHPDLVFRDDDHVAFYWTGAKGGIPEEPTFTLDLEELRSSLPARTKGIIDPANLLSSLQSQVTYLTRDFDRDGVEDLLLRRGSKVSVYRGGPSGVDRDRATQVLRTAGNLLAAYSLDDDGDGLDDLCLLLVSDISIGQILVWLVAGTSLTLDLYVYRQESPLTFSRKPTRRRELTIDVPSLISLTDEVEDRIDVLQNGFTTVPVAGDFDGDGGRDDIVVLEESSIDLYFDAEPSGSIDDFASGWYDLIARFDRESGGKESLEIELYDIVDWVPVPGRQLRHLLEGKAPSRSVALEPESSSALFVTDVDGDGADDVIGVTSRRNDTGERELILRIMARFPR